MGNNGLSHKTIIQMMFTYYEQHTGEPIHFLAEYSVKHDVLSTLEVDDAGNALEDDYVDYDPTQGTSSDALTEICEDMLKHMKTKYAYQLWLKAGGI